MPKDTTTNKTPGKDSKAVKLSISMPKSVLSTAETKAEKDGRSLSNYLANLVRRDCAPSTAKAA